jgi:hypothetical protein
LPRQPDKVFKTINYAATFLLEDMAWEEHIDEIFARLGGATGTQRISVYENLSTSAPEVQFLQRYSWQAATDAPYKQIQGLDQIIFQRPDMSRWAHQLRRGETILVKASQAHKPQQDILTGLGIPCPAGGADCDPGGVVGICQF